MEFFCATHARGGGSVLPRMMDANNDSTKIKHNPRNVACGLRCHSQILVVVIILIIVFIFHVGADLWNRIHTRRGLRAGDLQHFLCH